MVRLADLIFFRNHRLCPRWMCFTFDNGLRRLIQNPEKIIKPYIHEGDTVLDVGPGIGYFTLPMAKLVGPAGRVIAADIQASMLDGIDKRAVRAGLRNRISLHLANDRTLGVGGKVDFVLAFWMAHEVHDLKRLFLQLHDVLKIGGHFLLAEPKLHVSRKGFATEVRTACESGFEVVEMPAIALCKSVLFVKSHKAKN